MATIEEALPTPAVADTVSASVITTTTTTIADNQEKVEDAELASLLTGLEKTVISTDDGNAATTNPTGPAGQAFRQPRQEQSLISRQVKHLSSGMSFQDPSLQIPQPILDALVQDLRFEAPSEIQAVTIPRIVAGKNVIAQAQTGSGKTIAFAIGMLIAVDPNIQGVQALCLTPTRELAIQIIDDAIAPLSKHMNGIVFELLVPDEPGKPTRNKGGTCTANVIVGTPGTIKGLFARKYLKNLKQTVKVFVCDEADTMVDQRELGQDTVQIKSQLDPNVQTLFFSATYTDSIISFSKALIKKAAIVKLKTNTDLLLNNIFQVRINVNKRPDTGENKKIQILKEIYGFFDIEQSIVFVTTRQEAEAVARMFLSEKYSVSFLHGQLGPDKRDEEFRNFREGRTKVLVTTNVLARGVNVPSVDVVINYDLPVKPTHDGGASSLRPDPDTYVHRMGRCGRFGRQGTAITLTQTKQDEDLLLDIEHHFNFQQQRMTVDWDPNEIESLAEAFRERSITAVEPVHLECKVEVNE